MGQRFDLGDFIGDAIDRNPGLDFETIWLGIGASLATLGGALPAPTRTACAPSAEEIAGLLSNGRFDLSTETVVQGEMEQMLVAAYGAAAVSREHRLGPGDRPDFLIDGRIVIEVKGARHRSPDVLRQIERYANHPQVEWIIVATARAMHLPKAFAWRETGRRVPVSLINLGRAWL